MLGLMPEIILYILLSSKHPWLVSQSDKGKWTNPCPVTITLILAIYKRCMRKTIK